MLGYKAPVRDATYVLDAVVGVRELATHAGFGNVDRDTIADILSEGGKFVEQAVAPLDRVGDPGCIRQEDGRIVTPAGYREAYKAFCEAGWSTLLSPTEYGGQGLPHFVWLAFEEFVLGGSMSFSAYLSLTNGVIEALIAHGTEQQRQLYLPRLVSGEWSGTMNLTEPQCGTDLGLVRTRAERRQDGTYAVTGNKIFITSGEHDLTSNIIHLVLARVEGAPAGVRGLSLFLVPKNLVRGDGTIGARNAVCCTGIEHKMGLSGSATCALSYDAATGFLVGEESKGLAAMFVMMNLARLQVGVQGLGGAEAAYQHAVRYARERRQGRALKGPREPHQAADLLLVHPDVRRMLMECKSLIEGSRAFCLWAALQADLAKCAPTEHDRHEANELLGLLTPVVKAFTTDLGYRCATTAQQVFGGHGYIRDIGAEQFVRDVRITMVYEGANGVQAMDLAARKVVQNGGRAASRLIALMEKDIQSAADLAQLRSSSLAFARALEELCQATRWLVANGQEDPDNIGAGAYSYLEMMGIACLGFMWLKMARYSAAARNVHGEDVAFHEAKLMTAQFYFDRLLPDIYAQRPKIESGSRSTMQLPDSQF